VAFKILVVNDELIALETMLPLSRLRPISMSTPPIEEAYRCVRAEPNGYAVVLLDLKMPRKDGAVLAKQMLAVNPHLQIVMNSGDKAREALKQSYAAGVADFLEKDMEPRKFRAHKL
jgi:DNA-binding NtrC family response regulator